MRVLELLLPAGLTLRGLLRWVLLPQPYTERVKRKLQDYGREKKSSKNVEFSVSFTGRRKQEYERNFISASENAKIPLLFCMLACHDVLSVLSPKSRDCAAVLGTLQASLVGKWGVKRGGF